MLKHALRRCKGCYQAGWLGQLCGQDRYARSFTLHCADSLPELWKRSLSALPSTKPNDSRIITFPLAQTGEGIAECELVQWFVQEGDEVEEFGQLCEVQSDKAAVEITSRYAGLIKRLHHQPGDMIPVGGPLVDILLKDDVNIEAIERSSDSSGSQDSSASAGTVPSHVAAPVIESSAQQAPAAGGNFGVLEQVKASPAVRAMAREEGVDLAEVAATGPGNRILKEDIAQYMQMRDSSATRVPLSSKPTAAAGVGHITEPAFKPPPLTPPPMPQQPTVIPFKGYRRAMVKSMTAAAAVPHFHFCDEVLMDELIEIRQQLKAEAPGGVKLTVLPFAIKALSQALHSHPMLNSQLSLQLDGLTCFQEHNIGIAMATAFGLVVPNIKNVEQRSILEIAQELERLKAAANMGHIAAEDLKGGTISLSNIGSMGGTYATPLVNLPEVAICALGKLRHVPAFLPDGTFKQKAAVMNISWGADHRAVDGAALAAFSNTWKSFLEKPSSLLLHLR